jgi:hypothetical protein
MKLKINSAQHRSVAEETSAATSFWWRCDSVEMELIKSGLARIN